MFIAFTCDALTGAERGRDPNDTGLRRLGPFHFDLKPHHFGLIIVVSATTLLAISRTMSHDQPIDPDAGQTVTLSRKDLLAARRLLGVLLGDEADSSNELLAHPACERPCKEQRSVLIARARDEFQNRRRRVKIFSHSMFGEAAWDMLIALYIRDMSGQRQTLGGLMQFSGTPTTTAKRWLEFLAAHDLVRRDPHPTDQRTAFVSLTEKARDKLDLYYSETVTTAVSTSVNS